MGGRKKHSTLIAAHLLTDAVHTAWRARSGCVVSMLGLNLAGALDNVSHERLQHVRWGKDIPAWVIRFIEDFLSERTTRMTFAGYTSDTIKVRAGFPQGSPLSPILFLFFIAELLEGFQTPGSENVFEFGFIDNTNLVAWGDTAADNCRQLSEAHCGIERPQGVSTDKGRAVICGRGSR